MFYNALQTLLFVYNGLQIRIYSSSPKSHSVYLELIYSACQISMFTSICKISTENTYTGACSMYIHISFP